MKVINKKARYNYEILDKLEAGIVLIGAEVKSAKLGQISLKESYVRLIDKDLWLINATITAYKFANNQDYEPNRSRKLLLHRRQILSLAKKIENSSLTIVPTAMYTKGRVIKVEIALARGKKQYQKKEKKKKRDLDREQARALKYL